MFISASRICCVGIWRRFSHLRRPLYEPNSISSVSIAPYSVSKWKASISFVLTPISLRQSLNMPSQSLKVPIFATLPGIIPLLHHIQPNCFQLCVMLNRVHAQLAAEARTLVPPKWQRCIHQSVSVNPYGSRFESTRD